MFKNYRLRDYDFKLIILVLALSVVGILTIGSAEPAQQNKQIAGVAVGLVIMIVLSFFNYSVILKLYWLMYIGNLVLLGLVILMGEEGNGAQRWLKIGGLQFQPSELAKILLILFFAQFIMKYKEKNYVNYFADRKTVQRVQNIIRSGERIERSRSFD